MVLFGSSKEKKVADALGISEREVSEALNYQAPASYGSPRTIQDALSQMQSAKERGDMETENILLLHIDDLAARELQLCSSFASAQEMLSCLPEASSRRSDAIKKCLEYCKSDDQAMSLLEAVSSISSGYSEVFDCALKFVVDADQAQALFQKTDSDSAEEEKAFAKWLEFANNTDDVQEVMDSVNSDSALFVIACRKFISFITGVDSAIELFNVVPQSLEEEVFDVCLGYSKNIADLSPVYDLVSDRDEDDTLRKKADIKLDEILAASLANAHNFGAVKAICVDLDNEGFSVTKMLFQRLLEAATLTDMPEVYEVMAEDGDLSEFASQILDKWLSLVESYEQALNLADDFSDDDEISKINAKAAALVERDLAAARGYAELKEIYDALPDEAEFATLAIKKMIPAATTITEIDEIQDAVDNYDLEDLAPMVFARRLEFANSLEDIREICDNNNLSLAEKKLLAAKIIPIINTIDHVAMIPDDCFDFQDSAFQALKGKIEEIYSFGLPNIRRLDAIQRAAINAPQNSQAKLDAVRQWNKLASDALMNVFSLDGLKAMFPNLPPYGEARRKAIKKAYDLV